MQPILETYPFDYGVVFNTACAALRAAGYEVKAADPAHGVIQASAGVSALSWGENIILRMGSAQPGETTVAFESDLKFGLIDWGKNRSNVEKIQQALAQTLAQGPAQ